MIVCFLFNDSSNWSFSTSSSKAFGSICAKAFNSNIVGGWQSCPWENSMVFGEAFNEFYMATAFR